MKPVRGWQKVWDVCMLLLALTVTAVVIVFAFCWYLIDLAAMEEHDRARETYYSQHFRQPKPQNAENQ